MSPPLTRPPALFPLFGDIDGLPGIGKRTKPLFAKLAGDRVLDLLFHVPLSVIDRSRAVAIADIEADTIVRVHARVERHFPPRGRAPYRVVMRDGTGELSLVFFQAKPAYIEKILPPGAERHVSGRADLFGDRLQIVHPDYVTETPEEIPVLEPVYPLTAGLGRKAVAKAAQGALEKAPGLPEWLPESLVSAQHWPRWLPALHSLHVPSETHSEEERERAARRLAFDELYANQLAVQIIRAQQVKRGGRSIAYEAGALDRLRAALPYTLTGDQDAAIAAALADMKADTAMLRLVQGDVGSGKTMVALFAIMAAASAGIQSAFLAPTELLARQHVATLEPILRPLGVRCALLTGKTKAADRAGLLEDLAAGRIHCVIGTHALFQDPVEFHDLGLAVVDEQHRFGVYQRLALAQKARGRVDMLVMTATPIPRTLTLAIYGDMDVSRIEEKPPGRQPVTTRVVSQDRLGDVEAGLKRALERGERAYWVCPLVEESEDLDATAAEDRYKYLAQRFPGAVGLVHGRLSPLEKAEVMDRFRTGQVQILVATTVIEVGVDVPEATIMIIEHAERFGLAQLHQLRGRVGRGAAASTCLLLRGQHLSQTARERLDILRRSEDGFYIAEEDLRLRGAGEVLGKRQSGLPQFKLASLERDQDLIAMARDQAKLTLSQTPKLEGPDGEALRTLLYLFERDAAVRTLRSG